MIASDEHDAITIISALSASTANMMRMGKAASPGRVWVGSPAPNTYSTGPVVNTCHANKRPTVAVNAAPKNTHAVRTQRPAAPTSGIRKAANRGVAINSAGKCRMIIVLIINL